MNLWNHPWYQESPRTLGGIEGATNQGSSYRGSLAVYLRFEMKRTLTADLRSRGFEAAARGDLSTAAAFEREYIRRMSWVREGLGFLHGGRSAFGRGGGEA